MPGGASRKQPSCERRLTIMVNVPSDEESQDESLARIADGQDGDFEDAPPSPPHADPLKAMGALRECVCACTPHVTTARLYHAQCARADAYINPGQQHGVREASKGYAELLKHFDP